MLYTDLSSEIKWDEKASWFKDFAKRNKRYEIFCSEMICEEYKEIENRQ